MSKPTPVRTPSGITPDEAQMLRKRQEWRGRALASAIDYLENHLDARECPEAELRSRLREAVETFRPVADDVRRDMQRLLQTEIGVPQLEGRRHAANYFLDNLLVYVRQRAERRHREAGGPMVRPLESMSDDELQSEIGRALGRSLEAVPVFLAHITHLQDFELEVRSQRRRLQFLLGCDRSLRNLAESNADIIEAPLDEFAQIVSEFFRVCRYLKDDLPPLLEHRSGFPGLTDELRAAREHLDQIVSRVIDPLEALRFRVRSAETGLLPLSLRLDALQDAMAVVVSQIEPLDPGSLLASLAALEAALQALSGPELDHARSVLAASWPNATAATAAAARQALDDLPASWGSLRLERMDPVRRGLNDQDGMEASPELGEALVGLRIGLSEHGQLVERARGELLAAREANASALKESICQEMGFIRSTFLQPRFAHIAATDPRSTHTPQYFYFKEFADEANRSQQLLELVLELWQYLERLQERQIDGLRFSPKNLGQIARRVFEESQGGTSGPSWTQLATFLQDVENRLVPRLQTACALPGIRFDDRNQLAEYAEGLARGCGQLIAQRASTEHLLTEMQALNGSLDPEGELHDRYLEVVLRVSSGEMLGRLREVSRTLVELSPFVGAMIGGIRMRTSLAFYRTPPTDPLAAAGP